MAPNGLYYNAEVDDETGEEVSNTIAKPEPKPIQIPPKKK
jgi:hypothetical protein